MKLSRASGLRGIVALALLTGAAPRHAQAAQEAEKPTVVAIRIVKEDGQVLSESPSGITLETGKPVDREKIAESLRALYRTGDYGDLRAVLTPVSGGVRLDFVARENLFFNQVRIEGLIAPPSDASAAAAMQLALGQTYRQVVERSAGTIARDAARRGLVPGGSDRGGVAAPGDASDGHCRARQTGTASARRSHPTKERHGVP